MTDRSPGWLARTFPTKTQGEDGSKPQRMKIEPGERDEQWRVILDNGMLGGLITRVGDSYQVDMLMQIEAECSSEGEAMGFVQGVIAAYDIFFPAEHKD